MYSESIITCSWSQVEIQMEEFFSVAVRTCPCPVSPSFVPINGTLSLGSLIPFLTVGRKHVCLWGYEDLPGQPELKLTGLNNIHLIIFSLWTHFFLFVTIAESFIRGRCGKCAAFEHREKEELNNFSYGGGLHQISPKCGGVNNEEQLWSKSRSGTLPDEVLLGFSWRSFLLVSPPTH